jgi:hypothetical protein
VAPKLRIVWNRTWLWLTVPFVIAGIWLLGFCQSHRVWSLNEWQVYQAMEQECHPVWRDFHYGHIQAGDSVEEIIVRTQPLQIERTGPWVILKYHPEGMCFTGLTAAAYDGRMVGAYAWRCTWIRQFFDIMSPEQRAEFFEKYYDQLAWMKNRIVVR